MVKGCTAIGNKQSGMVAFSFARIEAADCTIKGNGNDGIAVQSGAKASAVRCILRGNNNGIFVTDPCSRAAVSQCQVRNNRNKGGSEMEEKDDADQGDDDGFLDQGVGQRLD